MDLVETYLKLVKGIVNEDGVYPQQGVIKTKNNHCEIVSFALPGLELWTAINRRLRKQDIQEYIFGMDLRSIEEDGTEFSDLLLIAHVKENQFHIGVLEYKYNDGNAIWKDIDWNNEYYKNNFYRYSNVKLNFEEFKDIFLV